MPFVAGTTPSDFSHVLSAAEEALLANYEDLEAWFIADGDQPEVNWFAFDVPLSIGSESESRSGSASTSPSESTSQSASASAASTGQPYRKRLGGIPFNAFRSKGQW